MRQTTGKSYVYYYSLQLFYFRPFHHSSIDVGVVFYFLGILLFRNLWYFDPNQRKEAFFLYSSTEIEKITNQRRLKTTSMYHIN